MLFELGLFFSRFFAREEEVGAAEQGTLAERGEGMAKGPETSGDGEG
jgi:hypothetical protein